MRSLISYIEENYITEMACNLSRFRDQVSSLKSPIIIHWCLTKWAEEHPDHHLTVNRKHWVTELKGFMNKIAEIKLKSGRKDKTLYDLLINDDELDDPISISAIIRDTFVEYGLQKYIVNISYECAENIKDICRVMNTNHDGIEDYCKEPLGLL